MNRTLNNTETTLLLDRDGVLNVDLQSSSVCSPEQFLVIDGVFEALRLLHAANVRVLIITNQACIGRGDVSRRTVDAIHRGFLQEIEAHGGFIEDIFICPHRAEDNCQCRKPLPGLVLAAQQKYHFEPTSTCFVGDDLRDIQSAEAAGCRPVLVLTGKGEKTRRQRQDIPVFDTLLSFVQAFCPRHFHHQGHK